MLVLSLALSKFLMEEITGNCDGLLCHSSKVIRNWKWFFFFLKLVFHTLVLARSQNMSLSSWRMRYLCQPSSIPILSPPWKCLLLANTGRCTAMTPLTWSLLKALSSLLAFRHDWYPKMSVQDVLAESLHNRKKKKKRERMRERDFWFVSSELIF